MVPFENWFVFLRSTLRLVKYWDRSDAPEVVWEPSWGLNFIGFGPGSGDECPPFYSFFFGGVVLKRSHLWVLHVKNDDATNSAGFLWFFSDHQIVSIMRGIKVDANVWSLSH